MAAPYPWIKDGKDILPTQIGNLVVTSTLGLGFSTSSNNKITGLTNTPLSITSPGTGSVAINTHVTVSQPGILTITNGTNPTIPYISFNGIKLFVTSSDPAALASAGDIWISTA
jgi:hypothetical protein